MSTETEEMMATKPVREHEWLQKLVGEWRTETEMTMGPGGEKKTSKGTENVISLGGLWAAGEGQGDMPDGTTMEYRFAIGYDVSFKEYRGCWFASMSSHLWKQVGELSEDGKVMTLNCDGPDMVNEGKTAKYRDVIEIPDENTRIQTSYFTGENGEFQEMMKCTYTRV